MVPKMNTNTKWTMAVVAAFAVGVSATALLSGQQAPEPATDMAAIAEQMNDIQPVAGDAAAPTTAAEDQVVIAKVNGQDITLGELKAQIKVMPEQLSQAPLEQVFPMMQDQMVMGAIISSKSGDLANDPEVQQRLAVMKENIIRATYVERQVKAKITDEALKKEYDAFVKDFKAADEVSAQHILVDDEAKAKEIITKIKGGAKFEDMVKEFSKDKGAAGTGDLGYFKQTDMVKEFADAAFGMKKGELSKTPVKTQFGWHVIQVNDRRKSSPPTFEALKPELTNKMQREAFDSLLADLRKDAKIELFDMTGKPAPKAEPAAAKAE